MRPTSAGMDAAGQEAGNRRCLVVASGGRVIHGQTGTICVNCVAVCEEIVESCELRPSVPLRVQAIDELEGLVARKAHERLTGALRSSAMSPGQDERLR
jgi:hypothetical protein